MSSEKRIVHLQAQLNVEKKVMARYHPDMDKGDQTTYDGYIKALTDISRAITSDLFLEDLQAFLKEWG